MHVESLIVKMKEIEQKGITVTTQIWRDRWQKQKLM